MKARLQAAWRVRARWWAAVWLTLCAAPAIAQTTGPITTQSLFFTQASLSAQQGNYAEIDAGLIYTDNVFLTPNATSDTLALLGLVADTAREGPRLDYRLSSDIALVKYFSGDFQTRPFGYLDGEALFKIVPGFFDWKLRDTFNQWQLSTTGAPTPDNLEAINFFQTGPSFTWQPTLRTSIVLDGIYSWIKSSSQSPQYINVDNHRYGGDLNISRAFTTTTSAFVKGTYDDVKFVDTAINNNFTQEQVEGGLSFSDKRTLASISGGYARVHETVNVTVDSIIGPRQEPQKQTNGGSIWQGDLSRLISPTQRVTLHAQQIITDAAGLFQYNLNQPVPASQSFQLANGQPFTERDLGASWRFQENRTSLQIDLYSSQQIYSKQPTLDHKGKIVSALLSRQLSPVLTGDLGLSYQRDEYAPNTSDTVTGIVSVRWQVGQRLGLRFVYAYSAVTPNGYHNNQIGVIASYGLNPRSHTVEPLQPAAPFSSQQPYESFAAPVVAPAEPLSQPPPR
jgi:hypothetical protein